MQGILGEEVDKQFEKLDAKGKGVLELDVLAVVGRLRLLLLLILFVVLRVSDVFLVKEIDILEHIDKIIGWQAFLFVVLIPKDVIEILAVEIV